MIREVVGELINCPRCKNGCRYCHGHGIIINKYKRSVLVDDKSRKPKPKRGAKREKV